ncbi:MAG: hypothetical protein HY560_11780 [Gemmatimonadetes bacterium]|nr:hypothetical protein [Gemmatimonadota bacterium]
MTRLIRVAGGAAFALASMVAVGALSRVPFTAEPGSHALLKLAWRTRGERVQECRRRTPEELARLPVHMREDEVCEGRVLPYRLEVMIDGAPALNLLVRGGGVREDRPIYVYRQFALSAGSHHVRINFVRQGEPRAERAEAERGEPHFEPERGASRGPRVLTLDTTVALGPRHVALVTYDPEAGRLIVKTPS